MSSLEDKIAKIMSGIGLPSIDSFEKPRNREENNTSVSVSISDLIPDDNDGDNAEELNKRRETDNSFDLLQSPSDKNTSTMTQDALETNDISRSPIQDSGDASFLFPRQIDMDDNSAAWLSNSLSPISQIQNSKTPLSKMSKLANVPRSNSTSKLRPTASITSVPPPLSTSDKKLASNNNSCFVSPTTEEKGNGKSTRPNSTGRISVKPKSDSVSMSLEDKFSSVDNNNKYRNIKQNEITPIEKRVHISSSQVNSSSSVRDSMRDSYLGFSPDDSVDGNEWSLARRRKEYSPFVSMTPSTSSKRLSSVITPSNNNINNGGVNSSHTSHSLSAVNNGSIKVAVRVRPFSSTELQSSQLSRRIVSGTAGGLVIVNPASFEAETEAVALAAATVHGDEWARIFHFDHCLWSVEKSDKGDEQEFADQEVVHRAIGLEIVENVLNGISSSCFAYGHTGTGKTYSFFGNVNPPNIENEDEDFDTRYALSDQSGLIPRVLTDIIEGLKKKDGVCDDTKITLSFMEIYNEKIRDLLHPSVNNDYMPGFEPDESKSPPSLKVREHPTLGPYVEKLTKVEVKNPIDALRLLYEGHKNRATAKTFWNKESSRSHAIVTLELTPLHSSDLLKNCGTSFLRSSSASTSMLQEKEDINFVRLQMVDLAGSEQDVSQLLKEFKEKDESVSNSSFNRKGNKKSSQAVFIESLENRVETTKEKQENKYIRRSLSTLGYIIKSLGKGISFKSLPYRDTLLTWLLRDALNGKNHTTMLATLSPSGICYEEDMNTLKYAERLCLIGNKSFQLGELSLFANKSGSLQSQKMSDEFTQILISLGAGQPGTKAYRQLLKQTIGDPQQRLARMLENNSERADTGVSQSLLEGGGVPTHSNDEYLALQNKIVALQLDLKAALIERDGLAMELQTAREALLDGSSGSQKQNSSTMLLSSSSSTEFHYNNVNEIREVKRESEQETRHLKEVLSRKDETIARLQQECNEEKVLRLANDRANKEKMTELLESFENLQRRNENQLEEISGSTKQWKSKLEQASEEWAIEREKLQLDKVRLSNELNKAREDKDVSTALLYQKDEELRDQKLKTDIFKRERDISEQSLDLKNKGYDELAKALDEMRKQLKDKNGSEDDNLRVIHGLKIELQAKEAKEITFLKEIKEIEFLRDEKQKLTIELNKTREEKLHVETRLQLMEHEKELVQQRLQLQQKSQQQTMQITSVESGENEKLRMYLIQYLRNIARIGSFETPDTTQLITLLTTLHEYEPPSSRVQVLVDSLNEALSKAKQELEIERTMKTLWEKEKQNLVETIKAQSFTNSTSHISSSLSTSNNNSSQQNIDIFKGSTEELANALFNELSPRLKNDLQKHQSVLDQTTGKLCQVLLEQVNQLRLSLDSAETKTQYWQDIAQQSSQSLNTINSAHSSSSSSKSRSQLLESEVDERLRLLRKENELLLDQLSSARTEATSSRTELRESQRHMQVEFASLWMVVQELSKHEGDKERAQLIEERNAAVLSLAELKTRLKEVTRAYNKLKHELQAIDRDLIEAAEAEGIEVESVKARVFSTSSEKSKSPLRNIINPNNNHNNHNNSATVSNLQNQTSNQTNIKPPKVSSTNAINSSNTTTTTRNITVINQNKVLDKTKTETQTGNRKGDRTDDLSEMALRAQIDELTRLSKSNSRDSKSLSSLQR